LLQQTRVAAATPYYRRFVRAFPTVAALARAPLSRVLAIWSGLGYYGRARNLHRAARDVVAAHRGRLPSTRDALRALPGFGPYTAGAVASIAFGEPVAVVDGNVARVYARWFGDRGDPTTPSAMRALWKRAEELVPAQSPGDWNQALMELGATVCVPRVPRCAACPIREGCRARATGRPERFGKRDAPPARPVERRLWAVVRDSEGRVAVVRRPLRGLWGGLYEFLPMAAGGENSLRQRIAARLGVRAFRISAPRGREVIRHVFTHKEVLFSVCRAELTGTARSPGVRWIRGREASSVPAPAPVGKMLREMRGRDTSFRRTQ